MPSDLRVGLITGSYPKLRFILESLSLQLHTVGALTPTTLRCPYSPPPPCPACSRCLPGENPGENLHHCPTLPSFWSSPFLGEIACTLLLFLLPSLCPSFTKSNHIPLMELFPLQSTSLQLF